MTQKKQTKKTPIKFPIKTGSGRDDKKSPKGDKPKIDKKQKIKPYKYGDFMSRFSIQYWMERFKRSAKKRKLFLILMQLRNGKYEMFTLTTNEDYFTYQKGIYFLDGDMAREDVHTGLDMFYFHQDVDAPFKITFDLTQLKDTLKGNIPEVEKSINPYNLKSFISSQMISQVIKAGKLTDEVKFLKTLIILNILMSGGVLIMFGRAQGWF